jgi:hypothetical protein
MVESRRTSAHVWTSIEVDLEAVEQVRHKHKAAFRKAEVGSLTHLPFITRAVCDGLGAFAAEQLDRHGQQGPSRCTTTSTSASPWTSPAWA